MVMRKAFVEFWGKISYLKLIRMGLEMCGFQEEITKRVPVHIEIIGTMRFTSYIETFNSKSVCYKSLHRSRNQRT